MSNVLSSIGHKSFSHADYVPQVLQGTDGEIQVHISSRARLTAAVSLASLMVASTAAAQEGGLQLPTIDVAGDQSGGYQATQQSITRLPTRLLDTPQTVNVVTQQALQDQRATTMEDALRNVVGITFNAGEGGMQGDAPVINGQAARGDIFRDGIRDPGWYTRDLFSVDRVEVYKGPSAFAFGRGATGGAINNVSKLANGATFAETTVTGSSAGGVRVDGDASGKVGNVAGRVGVMAQDLDTAARDNVWTKRWGIAPSATIDLTDQDKATLSYIYQGEESVPDYGVPWLPSAAFDAGTGARTGGYHGDGSAVTPVPVPRSNWYGFKGGPLRDLVQTNTHILTAKLEHRFNDAITVSNATRYISVGRMARPTPPRGLGDATHTTFQSGNTAGLSSVGYPIDQMTVGRQHFQIDTNNTLLLNQTDVLAKFSTLGLQHTVSGGMEVSRESRWQQRANLCSPTGAGACRTSLWNPDPDAAGGSFTGFGAPNETRQNTLAFYASDQIKLNQYFDLLGALRYDIFDTDYTVTGTPTLSRSDNLLSYRFGAVYHPIRNASIYAAFGNSYNPSAELGTLASTPTSTNNILLDPEKNVTYEAGAKWDVLEERLSLTASIFRTDKTNMRVPQDPLTGNNTLVLDGLSRVDGVELGMTGKLTDNWNVTVGYSHLESEFVETTNLAQKGNQLPGTPPNNLTFWSTYDVTPEFTVGGGAFFQDKAYADAENTKYVPSYWRFDAMASYRINKKMTVQLNVYNITDETYYAQYYSGHAVPAAGRYATLSLRTSW